jgi:hypothetical protein
LTLRKEFGRINFLAINGVDESRTFSIHNDVDVHPCLEKRNDLQTIIRVNALSDIRRVFAMNFKSNLLNESFF